jgi:hypothetical protein
MALWQVARSGLCVPTRPPSLIFLSGGCTPSPAHPPLCGARVRPRTHTRIGAPDGSGRCRGAVRQTQRLGWVLLIAASNYVRHAGCAREVPGLDRRMRSALAARLIGPAGNTRTRRCVGSTRFRRGEACLALDLDAAILIDGHSGVTACTMLPSPLAQRAAEGDGLGAVAAPVGQQGRGRRVCEARAVRLVRRWKEEVAP